MVVEAPMVEFADVIEELVAGVTKEEEPVREASAVTIGTEKLNATASSASWTRFGELPETYVEVRVVADRVVKKNSVVV